MKVIGVIGYSDDKCKTEYAQQLVHDAIVEAMVSLGVIATSSSFLENGGYHPNSLRPKDFAICSGLTNLGIPALAYEFAKKYGLRTIGIACSKAEEYECYSVDEKIIVGKEWGDESVEFLAHIDALVRIGGGPQSEKEAEAWIGAQKLLYEQNGQDFDKLNPVMPYIYKPLTREGT